MTTLPTWGWNLADLDRVPKNGLTVMSTFACGGGASLGYKRAGCDVIAGNDIDPIMAQHYRDNLKPRFFFQCPIKDLITADLPSELFHLDILDGSPPCSTFSMSGQRENAWGVEKHFREGQAKQVLDDLFFDWCDLVARLKPRVCIAENVKGMILGNARSYAKQVMNRLREIGYRPQLFLINAADCGVPQARERVFFVGVREDVSDVKLTCAPSMRHVSVAEACSGCVGVVSTNNIIKKWWHRTSPGNSYTEAVQGEQQRASLFNWCRLHGDRPSRTLTASAAGMVAHWSQPRELFTSEWIRIGSFPDDYKAQSDSLMKYMIGMSVPPPMTEFVARCVIDQWLLPNG